MVKGMGMRQTRECEEVSDRREMTCRASRPSQSGEPAPRAAAYPVGVSGEHADEKERK